MDQAFDKPSQTTNQESISISTPPTDIPDTFSPEESHIQNKPKSVIFIVLSLVILVIAGWLGYVKVYNPGSKSNSDTSTIPTESPISSQASAQINMIKYFDINQIRVGIVLLESAICM